MNIIRDLVLRFLNFIWRQHERTVLGREFVVLCDGGEGREIRDQETLIPMSGKQIDTVLRMLLSEEAHQAFAADAGAIGPDAPMLPAEVVEELERVAETFRWKRQDAFSVIVITGMAPPETGLKCMHEGKWHLLINHNTWLRLKHKIPELSLLAPFPLLGIPVVEDESLALAALTSAVVGGGGELRFDQQIGDENI